MAQNYNDDSIVVLEGLEAVRKRPGMYIGSTDHRGLHHLVWEAVDNAIDEALAGYGKEITVTINQDNSIEVSDCGRGMPCGMHKTGKNTLEIIFTVLHAGGKFTSEGGYKVSGGLHGVGAAVINALSSYLEVTSMVGGSIHFLRFENGKPVGEVKDLGPTRKTGTTVKFKPDPHIFSTVVFNYDTIMERIRESAFLISGLKMVLIDKRSGKKEEFCYQDGVKEYVSMLVDNKETLSDVSMFYGKYEDIETNIALQYSTSYTENIVTFVNNVKTIDGGTHEAGFKTGIGRAVNDYCKKYNAYKEKLTYLDASDVRLGIVAIVSLRIPENKLEFEGQTKGKLGTPAARTAVESLLTTQFMAYLETHQDVAEKIIDRATRENKARAASRKAREEARDDKKLLKQETQLSGKLSPAQTRNPNKNELYLVEGDSAGGSAKQGRDRKFQAILPLRGKVQNVDKKTLDNVLKNEELNTVIHTVGAGFGQNFDIKKCNYKKVIIMTDADDDGAHIQILLITFFFRYMRPLIDDGRLFIALPPLYKISLPGRKMDRYVYSDEELNRFIMKLGTRPQIQRYKGLGEMNAEQLWDTTMNPEKRTLIKVNISELSEAEKLIETLMGDNAAARREWLETHVEFSNDDDFEVVTEGDE